MGILRYDAARSATKRAGLRRTVRSLTRNGLRLPLRATLAALLFAMTLPTVQAASDAAPSTSPGAIPATRAELAAKPGTTPGTTPLVPSAPANNGLPPLPSAKPVDPRAGQQPAFAEPAPQPFAVVRGGRDTMPTTADNGTAVSGGRRQTFTFAQLGALDPLQLRGVDGQNGVPFSVRADEVVTGSNLHLIYSYSPSLLSNLSHLKVLVNGEVAATLPLPRESAGTLLARDIPLEPRLITEFN
ncbi:MAG: cellulose biosynthesis cyclic di-GMP-binding regulatory protein BcsB, partial [Paraburkholderia hospita]